MERVFAQKIVSVKYDDGSIVKFTLRPIPLKMVRSTVFQTLMDLADDKKKLTGWDTFDLILDKLEDVLKHCMVEGSTDDLDMVSGPVVLQAFLDQNLNDGILGNWRSLWDTVGTRFPIAKAFVPMVAPQAPEKESKGKSKKRKKRSLESLSS